MSALENKQKQEQEEDEDIYFNFINSIKSESTKYLYENNIKLFRKLDKEQSSYHEILDAFRLALKGINLVKKEKQIE